MNKPDEFRMSWFRLLLVLLLALLLYSPSLGWKSFADDYVHLGILKGDFEHPTLRSWSLFDFGSFEDFRSQTDEIGGFPWWTTNDWKARFFRPLSSLSLWMDYKIFGTWSTGQHLTNLLLLCLLLTLLYPLYRAWGLSPEAAFWSLLIFTCLDDNLTPVSWPANRNTIMAALFLVATALMMDRARQGKTGWLIGAFAAASAAVLSKESGIVGFLIIAADLTWHSYEFQKRLANSLIYRLGLALALVTPLVYLLALVWNGFGTRSLFYATPWHSPGRFLENLGILAATLWTNLCMPFSLDTLNFFPQHFSWLFWVASLPGCLIFIPILRRTSPEAARIVPGMLWMLVTLIPQAAVAVSDRLFLLPFVGGATLLGVFISRERKLAEKGFRRGFLWLVIALCLPLSALATFFQGLALGSIISMNRNSILALEQLVKPDERDLILLQSPYSMAGFSAAWTYYGETGDRARRFWLMQIGRREVRWERLSADTFTLESSEEFLTGPFERLFLTDSARLRPGQQFDSGILHIEILESTPEGIWRFLVRLDRSLDSPSLVFLKAEGDQWARIPPPAVGRTMILPAPQVSNPLFP